MTKMRSLGVALFALGMLACGGSDDGPPDSVNGVPASTQAARPETTSTPTATPEDGVIAAYLLYWDAYSKAVLNLDAGLMNGSASGDELRSIRDEVEQLRSQGVALRVVVTHKPVVLEISATSATLLDEMVNNSFFVDPVTKNPPVASGSGNILKDTYRLQKIDGRWVVTGSVRQRDGQP
jgi:hypothetical protein